jgi:uncharacterized protein (TIRG00374 family)
MKSKPASSIKNFLKWLPGILVSLIIIYLLLKFVNINDLKNAIGTFKIETLFFITALLILSMAARSLALQVMIGGQTKFQDSFFAVCVGYMLNNIIPRSGEFGKAILMGASSGSGTLFALSIVVVERALDLAILATMFLSTLPLVLQRDQLKPIAIISLLLVIIALIFLFLMANNKKAVHQWISRIGKKNQLVKKYVIPGLDSLLNGFSILTKLAQFLLSLFWILVCWMLWALLYYLAIRTFVPSAPFWWAFFAQAVLAMGIALPSAPAGLGVFEGALVGALAVLGVDQSKSLGMALVLHAIQIISTFILGGFGLMRQGWTLDKLLSQVKIKRN